MPNLLFPHRAWRESILVTQRRRLQSHSCSICWFTAFVVGGFCRLASGSGSCGHASCCLLAVVCLPWLCTAWYAREGLFIGISNVSRTTSASSVCIGLVSCIACFSDVHWRRPCFPRQYSVEHLLDKNTLRSYVRRGVVGCCPVSFFL